MLPDMHVLFFRPNPGRLTVTTEQAEKLITVDTQAARAARRCLCTFIALQAPAAGRIMIDACAASHPPIVRHRLRPRPSAAHRRRFRPAIRVWLSRSAGATVPAPRPDCGCARSPTCTRDNPRGFDLAGHRIWEAPLGLGQFRFEENERMSGHDGDSTPEYPLSLEAILHSLAVRVAARLRNNCANPADQAISPRLLTVEQAAAYIGAARKPFNT